MVRRVLCAVLCLVVSAFAAGCAESTEAEGFELDTAVIRAVEDYNALNALSVAFSFNVQKSGGEESLLFEQGTVSCRKGDKLALSGRVTQVSGGGGTTSDVYYKAGAYYNDSGTGKYYTIIDGEETLRSFFCVALPLPKSEDIVSVRTAQTSGGTKYVYTVKAASGLGFTEDKLYAYSGMRQPNRSKTRYGKAEYSYVVDENGVLKAATIETAVTLCDTAPYLPSYSVPDSELAGEYALRLEITLKAVGGDVVVEAPNTSDFVFIG